MTVLCHNGTVRIALLGLAVNGYAVGLKLFLWTTRQAKACKNALWVVCLFVFVFQVISFVR